MTRDVEILRGLVEQYAALAAEPVMQERRELWRAHQSLEHTRPLVLANFGYWNAWCRETFGDPAMQCEDPFFRAYERDLRMRIHRGEVGDDCIAEPWLTLHATRKGPGGWCGVWGLQSEIERPDMDGGAFRVTGPPIKSWDDMARMTWPQHGIEEEATAENLGRLQDAVGDLIVLDVNRGPTLIGFLGDISTSLAYLRGLQHIMVDMYESPAQLKELLAFMRDGILHNQQQAEDAGDITLTCSSNQQMPYARELEDPVANSGPRTRRAIWGFFAAQEYTLISPAFHDEFLYQFQLPLMEPFGLTHYGCCEDLTKKITMLRQAKNLRSIGVTPVADLAESVEQIGQDYVISWRPNPTDMVCANWDEGRIRRIIGEGFRIGRGTHLHVYLKDIESVQGDPGRLGRWVEIVQDEIERNG